MRRLLHFSEIVREAQQKQNRTNLQLASWLMVEAGELADHVLKKDVYNREIDIDDLISETGDVLHFLVILGQRYGFTLSDAMADNERKLRERGWIK